MVNERFVAWLRRHKSRLLNFGILVGLFLIVWAYFNAPVNINRMQPEDWKNFHAQEIGAVTIQKLAAGAPYQSIKEVDKIPGIGPVKMAQIKRYFTTWDTAKADVWSPGFIAGLILFFGGCTVKYCMYLNHKKDLNDFKKALFKK